MTTRSVLSEPKHKIISTPIDQEKALSSSLFPDFDKAPDGGTKAWLVAAGGFAILFSCLGFSNSFGAFEEYYLTHQLRGESPDNIAWIGSVSAFLQFAAGMVGGPMFDRFGASVRHLNLVPLIYDLVRSLY
jgi:hypothetical protein